MLLFVMFLDARAIRSYVVFFFFSSRRRHTRFSRDWSSDVCSSDLECGCDLIHPHGAPPFMVQGRKREAEIVAAWEKKYKVPIMSVAQNHVNALKTLKAKSIVGATYFPPKLNAIFAKYFREAGFTVRDMAGIDVPFNEVQNLSSCRVYAHIKRHFLAAKGADAIYMLGSGWRTLDIIETLERDLQVPVVHPVTARVWEIQKRLHVREPRDGFGHLLAA